MFATLIYNSLIILFIYTAAFTVYYAIVVFMSMNKNRIKNSPQYMTTSYNNNMIVVIYAHNNESTVVPLLEQLNKQNYPTNNYQVHIILDNCTDSSANKLEFIGGAKIWRLNNGATQGKDEAVSWLLERLITFKNVHAFVFLDATRLVDTNFLSSINTALMDDDIIVGSTDIILEDTTFKSAMLAKINEYKNKVLRTGRSVLGLATQIDSDVIALKHEVLEKIQCIDFKDTNGELKYTILLARNNFIAKYSPNVKTFVSSESYAQKKTDLKSKFSILSHCLKLVFSSKPKFSEFILSQFIPSPMFLFVSVAILAVFALNFNYTTDTNIANPDFFTPQVIAIISIISILLVSFLASLTLIKNDVNNIKYLATYILYRFYKKHIKPTWWYKLYKKAFNQEDYVNIEKATVPVLITDGKNTIPCKLDLISEDGLVRVVFKHKNKKYTTDSHIRMCDAIKSITDKLYDRGLRIKICQSCAYFTAKIDGTTNMLKGYCNKQVVTEQLTEPNETLLWNTCEFYLPEDLNKIIDLSSYKKNNTL